MAIALEDDQTRASAKVVLAELREVNDEIDAMLKLEREIREQQGRGQ